MDGNILLFPVILLAALCIGVLPLFRKRPGVEVGQSARLGQLAVVALAVSGLFYAFYYSISAWVWSFHTAIPLEDLTPNLRGPSNEYDGIETMVLYVLVFADVLVTMGIVNWLQRPGRSPMAMRVWAVCGLAVCGWFLLAAKILPPMSITEIAPFLPMPLLLLAVCAGLYFLYGRYPFLAKAVVVVMLAFSGLICTAIVSHTDLSYIVGPALKLQYHEALQNIYFQYDMLLSFLAYVYMRSGLGLERFAYLGEASYFFLMMALYFFGERFFRTKGLALLFAIAAVLLRLYCGFVNSPVMFQISPLRMDLWAIPLLLAYRKGPYHWSVGLSLGLLVVLHRNLGLIYLVAWAEFALVLLLLDVADMWKETGLSISAVLALVKRHLRLNAVNLALAALAMLVCLICFHELFSAGALTYRKMGVGMIQIARNSFYWCVPAMLAMACILLVNYRSQLDARYVATGMFALLLAVGNSMYFFGRSHQNNILIISTLLVLVLFIVFDVLISLFPDRKLRIPGTDPVKYVGAYFLLPFLFIGLVGLFYSGKIRTIVATKCEKFAEGDIVCALNPTDLDMSRVRKLTANSEKVYFLDIDSDVYHYYNGEYEPKGYYIPCSAWIYKKDLIAHVQNLLDQGYYIVFFTNDVGIQAEFVKPLKYGRVLQDKEIAAVVK